MAARSDVVGVVARAECDFCGGPFAPGERHRLVWHGPSQLILAHACGRCANRSNALLKRYGGRGRDAITFMRDGRPAARQLGASARASGALALAARGVVYLLIAVAFFLIVTLIGSQAR